MRSRPVAPSYVFILEYFTYKPFFYNILRGMSATPDRVTPLQSMFYEFKPKAISIPNRERRC
jgi:hypothetical protein